MAQKILTVRYGGDEHRVSVESTTTIGEIIANPNTRAVLGYGDNVRALVNGIEQSNATQISYAEELVLETKANEKAS
jgi:hypothetical protein